MGVLGMLIGLGPVVWGAWRGSLLFVDRRDEAGRLGAAFTLGWAWITIGVEGLGTFGLLTLPWLATWSTLGGGLGEWAARRSGGEAGPPMVDAPKMPRASLGVTGWIATSLTIWAASSFALVSLLGPVKIATDGPIYHLYFAARWWKEGRIFAIASPFGEVGATYFWANGEAWLSWLMTAWGGDRLARIGQAPFFVMVGIGVEGLARRLGASRPAARVASAWLLTAGPLVAFAFEANVDVILLAGYVLAVESFVRYTSGGGGVRALILGSMAAGLGMGTKPTGIVFFPPLLLIAATLSIVREPTRPKKLIGVAAAVLPALATMGYWPIRNARWTGNPLYPLNLQVGGLTLFRGWFGPDAMVRSGYYLPASSFRAMVDIVMVVVDPREILIWAFALLACWWPARGSAAGATSDRAWVVRALGVLAVVDFALYWLVIPYRTQQRFMFPALAAATVALAALFDRGQAWRVVGVAILAMHLLTSHGWPIVNSERSIPWDLDPRVPNYIPPSITTTNPRHVDPDIWWLGLACWPAGLLWARVETAGRRWRAAGIALAGTAALLAVGGWIQVLDRRYPSPFPRFRDYDVGWSEVDVRSGRGGANIAYAGHKIPYYLFGSGMKNRVRYVNVDAHRDWLMHDYFRAAPGFGQPATWPNPFPGWDRLRPDYDAWLANLRAEKIDLLVVTRVVIEEGPHNVADAERFPIERVWADRHPRSFALLYANPQFRIYRVAP